MDRLITFGGDPLRVQLKPDGNAYLHLYQSSSVVDGVVIPAASMHKYVPDADLERLIETLLDLAVAVRQRRDHAQQRTSQGIVKRFQFGKHTLTYDVERDQFKS